MGAPSHHASRATGALPEAFAEFFALFNRHDYFEAHEVLESAWLPMRGHDRLYLQGFIQLAGGFCHLKRHADWPQRPKAERECPAGARLLLEAERKLGLYPADHLGMPGGRAAALAREWAARVAASPDNPWTPASAPRLLP